MKRILISAISSRRLWITSITLNIQEEKFWFTALRGKVEVQLLSLPTWCWKSEKTSPTVIPPSVDWMFFCNYIFRGFTLSDAWNMLKKVHRRAQPNDGFARILLDLDRRIHGKFSMSWQHKKPVMKVCPICGKNAGLSTSSLKLHLQKVHRRISAGSVDSAMTMKIQKAVESLKISRGSSVSPSQKQSQPFMDIF